MAYATEYTPELREQYLTTQLRDVDTEGRVDEGRAVSSAYARGLGGQAQMGSMVGLSRAATASKKAGVVSDFNYKLAGMQEQERLTEENRAYETTEAKKDREFREKMYRKEMQTQAAMAANADRAAKIRGQQGMVVGGLTSLAGAALMGGMMSDTRAKKDVMAVGAVGPLTLYQFRYRTDEHPKLPGGIHIGFMAQDVEQVVPAAVITRSDGYKMVDYDRLGRAL